MFEFLVLKQEKGLFFALKCTAETMLRIDVIFILS